MSEGYFSHSRYSTYVQCPRLYAYRYVERVPVPEEVGVSVALVFGSAFHETVEHFLRGRHAGESVSMKDEFLELFGQRVERVAEQGSAVDWRGRGRAYYEALGEHMFRTAMVTRVIRDMVPMVYEGELMVEKKVISHCPGVPVPIVGYVDVVLEDGTVADFKTASRAWGRSRADESAQPTFYTAALRQMGVPIEGAFRYYVFVKERLPQVQVLSTVRTEDDVRALWGRVLGVWKSIEMGAFPRNRKSWKCNESWCSYWPLCHPQSAA